MLTRKSFAAVAAIFVAAGVHGIIYDYNGIALPPSSVLVSTHGLYGASNGVSAFVKATLSVSQGYNSAGRLTASEKLQMIFLKVSARRRCTSAVRFSLTLARPLARSLARLCPPLSALARCHTRSTRARSTGPQRCAAAPRAPAVG